MSKKKRQQIVKPKKPIKEYIYLDNVEVNSVLAQFEDGIPKVIEQIQQSTESTAEEASGSVRAGAEGGVNIGAKATGNVSANFASKNTQGNSDMFQEAVSTVYDDYAVDIMVQELENSHMLKVTSKQEEGSFVQLTSRFDLINPNSIGHSIHFKDIKALMSLSQDYDTNHNSIDDDLAEVQSYDESPSIEDDNDTIAAKSGFEVFKHFGNILTGLYPNSMLIKTNNCLTIAKKNNFRMNEAQLSTLLLSNRKITIIGKIESIINDSDLDIDQIVTDISPDISLISSFFPKLGFSLLNTMEIIKKDDRLIKPIAIYFE